MDKEKFESRILSIIKQSLKVQKLHKEIIPIKLVDNRDRYFLVQCENGSGRKTRLVFLRYDKWIFYIHGMSSMPNEYERREYTYISRERAPEKAPASKNKEKEEQKISDKLDKIIKKQEVKRERPKQ